MKKNDNNSIFSAGPSSLSFLQPFLFETHCAGCEIPPTETTISHRASLELVGLVICTFLITTSSVIQNKLTQVEKGLTLSACTLKAL